VRPSRPPARDKHGPRPARRVNRVAFAGVLLVLLLLPAITLQRAPSVAASTGDAVFHDISVTARFPEWISFRLDAASVTPILSAELFWASEGSHSFSVSAPRIAQGPRVVLEHEIDMTINYHPPGVDIVYFWRVTNTADHVTESPRQSFFYMDERHDWNTRTSGPVTLFWYTGGDSLANDILETSNRTIDRMRDRFGVVGDRPIRIVIYGDDRDFSRSLPPNSAEWIGGQAYPQLNLIFAVIEPGPGAQREVRRMIPHEVSHLMLNQSTWNPYNSPPNWLDEGLAVYLQETHESRFQQILDGAVRDGRLIPVRALNSSFPLDPDQALLSYAESWSIVTFIVEEHGDDALARLIAVFRDEVSYDEAVQQSLGINIDELDAQWKAWLEYAGDAPPETRNSTTADDGDGFTAAEKAMVLSFTGVAGLGGLGLGVYSIRRVRQMRSPR
jgi:hypothetical protein